MTAAKIAALTACRVDGCTASIHRRELCVRHYERTKLLVREGASWTDDAATLADLWRTRRERIRAEQRERGLTNMLGKRAAPVAPTAMPEPDRSGWPVLVRKSADAWSWRSGLEAIEARAGQWLCWPDKPGAIVCAGIYPTVREAADAIQARLPEDVAAVTAPDPRDAEIADLRSQVEAADRTLADITERAAALGMPAGLHIGTWWSTQLTEARERAREMEARANEAAAECERLRASPLSPVTSALLGALKELDPVEVLAEVYNIERDCDALLDEAVYNWLDAGCPDAERDIVFADEGARVTRPEAGRGRADDALGTLRRAIADAVDIDGDIPGDDELVRRLRDLDTDDDRDLAVVRDVIGACTSGLRRLAYDSHPPSPVAVDALCAVIERTVGVVRG